MHIRVPPEHGPLTLEVSVGLLHGALVQASAVYDLGRTPNAEAAVVNLRSLLEVWSDLVYLLRQGDPKTNAIDYVRFSLKELIAHVEETGMFDADLPTLRAAEATFLQEHPEIVGRPAPKGRYWSGINRTEQLRRVARLLGGGEAWTVRFYKTQSWDAHHVMKYLRDIRTTHDVSGLVEVGVGFAGDPSVMGERLAGLAEALLRLGWTIFCEAFNLSEYQYE